MTKPSVFGTLAKFVSVPDRLQQYDGPFSHLNEWHSATWGVLVGVGWVYLPVLGYLVAAIAAVATGAKLDRRGRRRLDRLPRWMRRQIVDEPHYFMGGVLGGVGLALGVMAVSALLSL